MFKGKNKYGSHLLSGMLFIILLASCGANQGAEVQEGEGDLAVTAAPVTIQRLEYQTLEKELVLGGLLRPKEEVTLMGGGAGSRIDRVHVAVGSKVSKGQVLINQDMRDMAIQRSNLEINRAELVDNLEKTIALLEAGAAAQSQVTALENQLQLLDLQIENLNLNLEKMQVRSTISGLVSALHVVEGQMASAQTPVATIVNIDTLKLDIQVGENYIGGIKEGQTIEVVIPSLENKIIQGKITAVPPSVDPRTKTFLVTVEISNPGHEIKGGMYAEVALVVARQEEALAVPQFAIVNRDDAQVVFVVQDGKALAREVEVGLTLGNLAEIVSGLEPGDEVIVEGQYAVSDGAPVEVVLDEPGVGDAQ